MEENKKKKKLNKKPLLICLAIALVFAVIGFIDIKSNAAESTTTDTENEFVVYLTAFRDVDGIIQQERDEKYIIKGNSDLKVYYYQSHNEPTKEYSSTTFYVVSDYPFTITSYYRLNPNANYVKEYEKNKNVPYGSSNVYYQFESLYYNTGQLYYYHTFETDCPNIFQLEKEYNYEGFMEYYLKNELEVKINYDNLAVDDDMPVPENFKRNIIKNEIKDSLIPDTLGGETYDYITWTNTSETYPLQLQVVPVVQYFDVRLTENIFTKEFYGEWNTQAIYEEVTNSFTLCTFATNPDTLLKYPLFTSGLSFKSECNDKYSKGFFEENYLKFGYRIRYVDIENEKASPWLVLVPTKELDDYKTFVEYADTSISDSSDGNGLFNEYENLDDIENAKTDIKTENEFKDKYDVVDGDVDVQEATNWLYSVVNFIKGTPQVVGSVLGFLPQPILYGMYVCIFLGIIASGLAIVKALL